MKPHFHSFPKMELAQTLKATAFCIFMACASHTQGSNLPAQGISLDLAPAAAVNGNGVFLPQICGNPTNLPDLRLTDAPSFDQTQTLTREDLQNLLASASPPMTVTQWTGAQSITLSRRHHVLNETLTLSLLQQALQVQSVKNRGDLELIFTEPWVAPSVPDEPLTVKILEMPLSGVAPNFIVRFELWTPEECVGTYQASLRAHVWRNVWVAHSNLERGELLSDADVGQERRDILTEHEALAQINLLDNGMELANYVEAENMLLARDLKPRAVVHRGQMADAILQDGALNIQMKVEVLEDGAPGQIVQVRNLSSLRNLNGKVVNDQTIAISL